MKGYFMDIHQKLEDIEDLLRRAMWETRKLLLKSKGSILYNNIIDMHDSITEAMHYQQLLEDTLHTLEYEAEEK